MRAGKCQMSAAYMLVRLHVHLTVAMLRLKGDSGDKSRRDDDDHVDLNDGGDGAMMGGGDVADGQPLIW